MSETINLNETKQIKMKRERTEKQRANDEKLRLKWRNYHNLNKQSDESDTERLINDISKDQNINLNDFENEDIFNAKRLMIKNAFIDGLNKLQNETQLYPSYDNNNEEQEL